MLRALPTTPTKLKARNAKRETEREARNAKRGTRSAKREARNAEREVRNAEREALPFSASVEKALLLAPLETLPLRTLNTVKPV